MSIVKSYWRFNPESSFTKEEAAKLAQKINECSTGIPKTDGQRYWRFMGWSFNLGRKPYLVDDGDSITRRYGRSVGDVREGCDLSRSARVVEDPFAVPFKPKNAAAWPVRERVSVVGKPDARIEEEAFTNG